MGDLLRLLAGSPTAVKPGPPQAGGLPASLADVAALPLAAQANLLLLPRLAPGRAPAGLAEAVLRQAGVAALGSQLLRSLAHEVAPDATAAEVPPCPAFLFTQEPCFPDALTLRTSAQLAREARAGTALPAAKRVRTAAAAAAPSQQQQQQPSSQAAASQPLGGGTPAGGTAPSLQRAAATLLSSAAAAAGEAPSQLPAAALEALDALLAGADQDAAAAAAVLEQAGLGALPDAQLLRLVAAAVGGGPSFARASAAARLLLLPRLRALGGAPSRDLAAAVERLAAANPHALLAGCLRELLPAPGFGGHQAEVVARAAKDWLPPQLLPELLAAACGRAGGGAEAGAHWTEDTVGVVQGIVGAKPPLTQARVSRWERRSCLASCISHAAMGLYPPNQP